MARIRDPLSAWERLSASKQRDQATRPQGIKKERPRRRSERISKLRRSLDDRQPEQRHASPLAEEACICSPPYSPELTLPAGLQNQLLHSLSKHQKRLREAEDLTNHVSIGRPRKRLRLPPHSPSREQTFDQETASRLGASQHSHISHWAEQKTWPKDYFHRDKMHHLLARQKSSASLRRKRSEASLTPSATPSDQRPREEKSAPYRIPSYSTLLETLGDSYMEESKSGVTEASKVIHKDLLKKKYVIPKDTLFRDDVFYTACRNLRDKNEARIILDIARLLSPSPETLAAFGDTHLDLLVESVNEGWNNCIPVTNTRPQPDFSVGFRRSMFSDEQLSKIQPLLGDLSSVSYFRATYYMYFPFLTSEVKCGATGLDIADRQNAHSMTLAVRGIVELYKLVNRESELHRELQTFSISHDHRTVRLYGYYPVFDGSKARIYRHQIHTFDITALNGKERWTTYNFTVAVYNHSLTLFRRIRSIVDELPLDFNREITQQFEPQLSESSGLSQQLEDQVLAAEPDSQSSHVEVQPITPETSTQERGDSNKKKRREKKQNRVQ